MMDNPRKNAHVFLKKAISKRMIPPYTSRLIKDPPAKNNKVFNMMKPANKQQTIIA